MNKQELIASVADLSGLGKGDTSKAVEAVFDVISAALKKGDEVRLVGFGTFSVSKRKASTSTRRDCSAVRARSALARFFICDFSSWQETMTPVGKCVIRTAE